MKPTHFSTQRLKAGILKSLAVLALAATAVTASPGAPPTGQVAGPATPRAAWKHGPPAGPSFFPLAVWLQSTDKATAYRAAGINLYIGLWQGPTTEKLAQLTAAGMPVFVEQTPAALAFKANPIIVGWTHQDEPDNAQAIPAPAGGGTTYGPCVPPAKIVAEYKQMHDADPTRPILLNLGEGVSNDAWIGRGTGASLADYPTYVQGADIASFDVYPVAAGLPPRNGDLLGYVPQGVDRLTQWTGGAKPVWNCIECTRIGGDVRPTPAQVRSEVWRALIHGSRGLIYFVHQFKPAFDEHALLDDPEMLAAVTAINKQIQDLAPVLNSPSVSDGTKAACSPEDDSLDVMVKQSGGARYLFVAETHGKDARGSFTVPGAAKAASAEAMGEGRRLPVQSGRFTDAFAPYAVHVYRLR